VVWGNKGDNERFHANEMIGWGLKGFGSVRVHEITRLLWVQGVLVIFLCLFLY